MKKFYIDIETNSIKFQENKEIEKFDIIPIIPSGNLTDGKLIKNCFLYTPPPKKYLLKFFEKFRRKISRWIKNQNNKFDESALNFCTATISRHFSLQYCSAFFTAQKILNNFEIEAIIVRQSSIFIDSGWRSPLINLIAILNACSKLKKNIKIIEESPNLISSLKDGEPKYILYETIYKEIKSIPNASEIIYYLINTSKNIRYSLTGRNQKFTEEISCLKITPNSLDVDIEKNKIGISIQFSNYCEISHTSNDLPLIFSNNTTSEMIEKSIYRCIYNKIILPLNKIEERFFTEIKNNNNQINAYIEETVDIESLGLISALKRSNSNIVLTQHSMNPILDVIKTKNNKYFPNEILANNKKSFFIYENYCKGNVFIQKNYDQKCIPKEEISKKDSSYILIIENDSITPFGIGHNIKELISDIKIFISENMKNGYKKYIWRQRDIGNTTLLNTIISEINNKDLLIVPNYGTPIEDLTKICRIAVGFGSTSSLAIDVIRNGTFYIFGSSKITENEYLNDISFISEYGPIFAAKKINQIQKDENYLLRMHEDQVSIVNSIYY